MSELFDLESWRAWFSGLDREFIFLLVLPFVVALVGLWSALVEKEEEERGAAPGEAGAPPERHVPERRQRVRRREDARRLSGSRG